MSVANPELAVNGVSIAIVPNTLSFDEGQPEKVIRAQAVGNVVTQDFSQNLTEAFSTLKFSLLPTVANIELVRSWQVANNTNILALTGVETVLGAEQQLVRTINNATVSNKPEINLGFDTQIEVEFKGDAAV